MVPLTVTYIAAKSKETFWQKGQTKLFCILDIKQTVLYSI